MLLDITIILISEILEIVLIALAIIIVLLVFLSLIVLFASSSLFFKDSYICRLLQIALLLPKPTSCVHKVRFSVCRPGVPTRFLYGVCTSLGCNQRGHYP